MPAISYPTKNFLVEARCRRCDDIIEAKHTYDLHRCRCGANAVYKGTEYQWVEWGENYSAQEGETIEDYVEITVLMNPITKGEIFYG